mmetsp:Transcript_13208/g.38376  ORF Transcript_13208/g.38376 Transcript_13208/m.38376 type:complete len:93 (+) Transcript_13208:101-379(+)
MLIAAICFREVFSHKDYKEAGLHDLLPKARAHATRDLGVVVADKSKILGSAAGERTLQKHHHHHHGSSDHNLYSDWEDSSSDEEREIAARPS